MCATRQARPLIFFPVPLYLLPLGCCAFSWRLSEFCHTSPDFHLGTEHPVLLDLCCCVCSVLHHWHFPPSTGPPSSLFSLKLTVLVLLLICSFSCPTTHPGLGDRGIEGSLLSQIKREARPGRVSVVEHLPITGKALVSVPSILVTFRKEREPCLPLWEKPLLVHVTQGWRFVIRNFASQGWRISGAVRDNQTSRGWGRSQTRNIKSQWERELQNSLTPFCEPGSTFLPQRGSRMTGRALVRRLVFMESNQGEQDKRFHSQESPRCLCPLRGAQDCSSPGVILHPWACGRYDWSI